jgi:hypothetical protein
MASCRLQGHARRRHAHRSRPAPQHMPGRGAAPHARARTEALTPLARRCGGARVQAPQRRPGVLLRNAHSGASQGRGAGRALLARPSDVVRRASRAGQAKEAEAKMKSMAQEVLDVAATDIDSRLRLLGAHEISTTRQRRVPLPSAQHEWLQHAQPAKLLAEDRTLD